MVYKDEGKAWEIKAEFGPVAGLSGLRVREEDRSTGIEHVLDGRAHSSPHTVEILTYISTSPTARLGEEGPRHDANVGCDYDHLPSS